MECFVFTCRLYGFAFLWSVLTIAVMSGCEGSPPTQEEVEESGPFFGEDGGPVVPLSTQKGDEMDVTTVAADPRLSDIRQKIAEGQAVGASDREYFSQKHPEFDWTTTTSYYLLPFPDGMAKELAVTYMGSGLAQDGPFEVNGIRYEVRNFDNDAKIYAPVEQLEESLLQEEMWRKLHDLPEEQMRETEFRPLDLDQ